MQKENSNPIQTTTNPSTMNPLDEYIQDIKSRNNKKSEPQKIEENAVTYDDLYNKLLQESHNIRSEILTKNKMNSTSVKINFREEKEKDLNKENNDISYGQDATSILFSRNINRALIFQSTENMNKDSKNDNNNNNENNPELLSPIVKIPEDQKSGFNTLNKLCIGTDIKNSNSNVKFRKENHPQINFTNNPQTMNSNIINQNIQNTNRKYLKKVDEKFSSKKEMNYNNNNNNISSTNQKIKNPSASPLEDFQILYLINNCKEIEKFIETDKPIEKIQKIEDKISKNLKSVDEIKEAELEIVEMKQEMELKLQEVKNLCRLYTDKLQNLAEHVNRLEKEECEKCKLKINEEQKFVNTNDNRTDNKNEEINFDENYTFDNFLKIKANKNYNQQREEKKIFNNIQNKIISEQSLEFINNKRNQLTDIDKYQEENTLNSKIENEYFKFTNVKTSCRNENKNCKIYEIINNNIDKSNDRPDINDIQNEKNSQNNILNYINKIEKNSNFKEISEKINFLLSYGKIKEATEYWKKINFIPLENSTFERSYEMLAQILKMKESDYETLNKKLQMFEREADEVRKKDIEIVQLFAEMELYRNIANQKQADTKELERIKIKLNNLINENSLLYKENVRLKFLIKEAEYQNMKTNSQTLFSSNNSINLDNFNSNNSNNLNNSKSKYFL